MGGVVFMVMAVPFAGDLRQRHNPKAITIDNLAPLEASEPQQAGPKQHDDYKRQAGGLAGTINKNRPNGDDPETAAVTRAQFR